MRTGQETEEIEDQLLATLHWDHLHQLACDFHVCPSFPPSLTDHLPTKVSLFSVLVPFRILSSTGLTGGQPGDIGQFTELVVLDLSYNTGLTGSLTSAIGDLPKLTNLILVGCNFNGPIPNTIGNLERLRYLSLNNNGFTGTIPASIGRLKNLYWLDLSANQLTGGLPVSNGVEPGLDMLTHAKHFHLGDNKLSGDIPRGLFNSNMSLIHLLFDHNSLTGNIPSTLSLVVTLEVVRLDKNQLRGDVPSNINSLTNVTEMYLSNNLLTGPIPNLTGMNRLNYLKMHYTSLAGELPAALFSIPQLQNVDLSNNRINSSLDITSNPSTQLELVDLRTNLITDFSQQRQYAAGLYTFGLLLLANPISTESGATDNEFCSLPTKTSASYSTPSNNCVPPPCGPDLVSSPNCQCAYPFTGLFKFKAPSFSSVTNASIYDSLHNLLTSFFRNATLPVDSLSLKNPHRNLEDYLVITLEVFPSGQPSFNRTGIIGVAFALSNQTFKPKTNFNTYTFDAESYKFFSGSAVGGCVLVVLLVLAGVYAIRQKERAEKAVQHNQPFGKYVPNHIKSKALWDPTSASGGVPQLKGARSFTFEELRKYTDNFSETSQIGAGGYGNGYMDPEYYMTQQLTEKSDVYSFGVVMLELITTRNPIERGKYIVREVKQVMDKNKELYNLHEILDPTIGLSSQLKGLEKFVDLSLRCVDERGNQRPGMSEIVKELESIMTFVGLNPGSEPSTSASYEGTDNDYSHPYSNDSLFAYSGGILPPKMHPK
ncbi:hypothetical protein L1987_30591 [Smallanthus sonchifolius]|uniref:Uncharacterized protein n=1 Tax=Smallanthus sonchifolius TaxID=185202 RepID=A0ACB9I384_9ASTR|nr:hypothetical protein L1987_30591 [Smallanthus sonchifolius]